MDIIAAFQAAHFCLESTQGDALGYCNLSPLGSLGYAQFEPFGLSGLLQLEPFGLPGLLQLEPFGLPGLLQLEPFGLSGLLQLEPFGLSGLLQLEPFGLWATAIGALWALGYCNWIPLGSHPLPGRVRKIAPCIYNFPNTLSTHRRLCTKQLLIAKQPHL